MKIVVLDVRATHTNNPDCPMRLAPLPDGQGWICVDCGFEILQRSIEVSEGRNLIREMLAQPDNHTHGLEKTEEELKTYDIPERLLRKIGAAADLSMGAFVQPDLCKLCNEQAASDEDQLGAVKLMEERPWWESKDVVGELKRRGWFISCEGWGMSKQRGAAIWHISAKDIIECYEVPQKGADRLEKEAGLR